MSSNLVLGVGFNSGKYLAKHKRKLLGEYEIWRGFLRRCYCPRVQKKQPTYIGCIVSENFKSYDYFYEWCQSQIGFDQEGYHLDKDLLAPQTKIYSEDTCVFLPQELNKLLNCKRKSRGNFPLGVDLQKGRYRSRFNFFGESIDLGSFKTPEEAFLAYKQAKETYIKLQAEKWKAHIDPRAYAALMAYEVSPTD